MRAAVTLSAAVLTLVAATLAGASALRPPASSTVAAVPCESAVEVDGVLLCEAAPQRDALVWAGSCGARDLAAPLRSGDAVTLAELCDPGPPAGRGRMPGEQLDALAVPVDLNRAPPAELESLPGIGPSLARAIVDGRPYASVDELRRVPGIGPARLAAVRPRARVIADAE